MRVTVEEGTQRVIRLLVAGLKEAIPLLRVVQSQGVFEPVAADLPVLRLSWRERSSGLLARPEYAVGVDAVASDFRFAPKAAGEQHEAEGAVLEDPAADFSRVVPGDLIRNLTEETVGTVKSVESTTSLTALGVVFAPEDEYDIHWPVDAEKHYVADRRAVVEMDLYAAPDAAYGSGKSLDEVERALLHAIWTDIRDRLQAEYVEVESLERVSDAGSIIASGLGADWYERAVAELTVIIGDGMAVRKPTVEDIPIPLVPRLTEQEAGAGKSGMREPL